MRLTEMIQLVIRRRSTVTAVNAALKQAGISPLDTRAVDNHLNWLGSSPRAIRPPERA
jgi:hypothetical protein